MLTHLFTPRRVRLASALGLLLPAAAFAQCPSADRLGQTIKTVFKNPAIEVKKVSRAALKGLCEVQVTFQGRPNVLYTDTAGAYFVTGHLIDAKNGQDLSEETLAALNSLSPEDLKKVDALVAMAAGDKGKTVYFVTDPM